MSPPSSNWFKLQKGFTKPSKQKIQGSKQASRKRARKNSEAHSTRSISPALSSTSPSSCIPKNAPSPFPASTSGKKEIASLRNLILGHVEFTEKQQLPGKYLAVDCEMVGVGIDGLESSLARVSLVNLYGAVILDEFVKQRERVVDYRTQWSGIREADLIHAKPFLQVQKQVADLLKDKILVGHAVHNDLKALLLSHPYPRTRDTQVLAYKSALTKTRRVALRNLVKDEIGLTIQSGEHSSVTDARATMAVYRLHKKKWDKLVASHLPSRSSEPKKRKRDAADEGADGNSDALESTKESTFDGPKSSRKVKAGDSGQGRKGVSSGLSTITRRPKHKVDKRKQEWWKQLPASGGSKNSLKLAK